MAEFQEVMRHWKRMCGEMDAKYMDRCCEKCPLEGKVCGAIYVMEESTDWKGMEKEIMAWAKEHPEPVYPTWGEWFVSIGMLPEKWDDFTSAYMDVGCVPNLIHSPIPADIAEKLGVEPKEDT